jgi:hypothetical protein
LDRSPLRDPFTHPRQPLPTDLFHLMAMETLLQGQLPMPRNGCSAPETAEHESREKPPAGARRHFYIRARRCGIWNRFTHAFS